MKRAKPTKTSKVKSGKSLKVWGITSIILLAIGLFLSITYHKTQDVRSRAEGNEIQFIDHVQAQVNGEDMSITVTKPETAQEGDVLVAMIGSDYAHVDTAPSGWELIRQDVKNKGHVDDLALQSYYKVVSPEEDSYTWNLVTKRKDTPSKHQPLIAVDLYVVRGVDTNNPIFSSNSHAESESPRAIKCPSVKGITNGMLLCSFMGDDPGHITAPEPMTQTSYFEVGENPDSFATAYEILGSDDKTGNRVARWDNPGREKNGDLKNGSDFSQAIVLRPAE